MTGGPQPFGCNQQCSFWKPDKSKKKIFIEDHMVQHQVIKFTMGTVHEGTALAEYFNSSFLKQKSIYIRISFAISGSGISGSHGP